MNRNAEAYSCPEECIYENFAYLPDLVVYPKIYFAYTGVIRHANILRRKL